MIPIGYADVITPLCIGDLLALTSVRLKDGPHNVAIPGRIRVEQLKELAMQLQRVAQ